MSTLAVTDRPRARTTAPPWWLALSVPLALLATAASLAGLLDDRVYAAETENWQTQAVGQDLANLVVFPLMLLLARAATRGSRAALLAWLGTVVYAAYGYAIYAFAMHYNALFLVYVAVLGLSVWALIGGVTAAAGVRTPVVLAGRHRFAGWLLVATTVAFALLWLAEDIPATLSGSPSDELAETGLLTNPVHVLDLSLFLPAGLLAGILLLRARLWGWVLAPVVLVAMAAISAGIVALSVLAVVRDQDGSLVVAAVIGALGIVQALTARHLLRHDWS